MSTLHHIQAMHSIYTIHAEAVPAQPWRNGGGQTRELLVWPTHLDHLDHPNHQDHPYRQNWQLRISRADIVSNGPFSRFDGVERWFVVLNGPGVLLHLPTPDGHTQDLRLLPGDAPLCFDGALAPGCTLIDGPTQDLNLMARGGAGFVAAVQSGTAWTDTQPMRGLYTAVAGVWTQDSQTVELPAHTLLWLEHAAPTAMHFVGSTATEKTQAWWLAYTPEQTP